MGAVDDIAHDYIGDGIDDLGDDGEDHQKCAAPNMGQLQNIRIVDIQIGGKHGVEQQCAGRAQQIPQPFFPAAHLPRMDSALKCFAV